MWLKKLKCYCFLFLFLLLHDTEAYELTGVPTSFNFGTIASPFADLTLTNNTICVGYTILLESSTYRVRATSSNSSSTAFQLVNTTNNAYTLNYTVSWAGTATGTPTFVGLNSGQNSTSTFTAHLVTIITCPNLGANATLRLQLLQADQMLAKQGNYTDTLTILIVAS